MKYKKINNKSNLGVEIYDFKIENHCSSIYIKKIKNLWLENSILIFKNLILDHNQFERISLLFGEFGYDPYIESMKNHPNLSPETSPPKCFKPIPKQETSRSGLKKTPKLIA